MENASTLLLKVCSSDLVSEEWIASLYTAQTTKTTPLDFRLMAIPVFRLIAVQCNFFKESIDSIRDVVSSERIVSSQVLSEASFDGQVKIIREKFIGYMTAALLSTAYSDMFMIILRLSSLSSAVNTNTFQISVPGSDVYQVLNNLYPIHENVTSINVSYFQ
jgi:hypothetical protein